MKLFSNLECHEHCNVVEQKISAFFSSTQNSRHSWLQMSFQRPRNITVTKIKVGLAIPSNPKAAVWAH